MQQRIKTLLAFFAVLALIGLGCSASDPPTPVPGPADAHQHSGTGFSDYLRSTETTTGSPDGTGQTRQGLTSPFNWSGYDWNIRDTGSGVSGPGPNHWRGASDSVWIDATGSLNLKMQKIAGVWYCSEVWMPTALGYGTYTFFVKSQGDDIDRYNVDGLFLYEDDTHEYDMEWARWGVSGVNANNGDFGSQPNAFSYWKQTIVNTDWHKVRIIWTAGNVAFELETNSVVVKSWSTTANTFVPGLALVHINNWLFTGHAPSNGAASTLTLVSFTYTP